MAVQVPVLAPARQTRLGGIRAAATWVENARLGAAESVVYISDGCTFPQPAIGLCFGEEVLDEKYGDGIGQHTGIGEPFALYGGVECFIGPDSDFDERARRILVQGEDRVIESRITQWIGAAPSAGTFTTVTDAIAAVETWSDSFYLGRPIIFMNRGDAVRASAEGSIEYGIDGLPYTVNGTPVVASGSVDAGLIGTTGAITVLRSGIEDIQTIEHATNKQFAVAEAVYSIIVDCDWRYAATYAAV